MESISLAWTTVIMQVLGLPGLIFVIWHFDNKRFARQEETRRKEMRMVLDQYRQDITEIKRLYESNSRLVEDTNRAFERLDKIYSEAIDVIGLNTTAMTRLAERIEHNMFCPAVRERGIPQ